VLKAAAAAAAAAAEGTKRERERETSQSWKQIEFKVRSEATPPDIETRGSKRGGFARFHVWNLVERKCRASSGNVGFFGSGVESPLGA